MNLPSIRTLVFHAPEAIGIAQVFQSNLRSNSVECEVALIDQLDRVFKALLRDTSTIVAIIWTPSLAMPAVTSTLREQSWRGIDVWLIVADDIDLGHLPPPLNSMPYLRFEARSRNGLSEAALKLAKLRSDRELIMRAGTKNEVVQMIASSEVDTIIPGRAKSSACNISHLFGAANGAGLRTYPLHDSRRAFSDAYGPSAYEGVARLLGYWMALVGVAAAAYAYRAKLIDLFSSVGIGSQGTAIIPFGLLSEKDHARGGALFALSACPLTSRQTTVHVDILPNEELPESITVQTLGSERVRQETHVDAVHCHVRRGEYVVVMSWGDGLKATPTAIEEVWTGQPIHKSFRLEIPIGSTRTHFRPQFFIKTSDNDPVPIELEFSASGASGAIRRLVGRLANGLPGKVFISYTRRSTIDKRAAKHYFDIWHAVTGSEPFWDTNSILVGDEWRDTIGVALQQTAIFVLIWSKVSSQSLEVAKEYENAVLLKQAGSSLEFFIVSIDEPMPPLPMALREYHVIKMPFGDQ